MKMVFVKTVRKTVILLLFLSILTLMLNLFLPTVSVTDSQDADIVHYFNFESMKNSYNSEVQQLYGDLNSVNILLWVVIIVSIISFVGLIIAMSEHYTKMGNAILLIGCSVFIFSLLSLIFYFLFVKTVIDMDSVSLANIFDPFRYAYIQMTLLIFLFIASMAYLAVVVRPFVRKSKKSKETEVKGKVKVEARKDSSKEFKEFRLKDKPIEWDTGAKKAEEKKEEPEKPPEPEEVEEVEFESEAVKEEPAEEKPATAPFEKEQKTEDAEELEEEPEDMRQSFENALNSAIGKKQLEKEGKTVETKTERPKQPVEEPPEEEPEKPNAKEFHVKCPQCSQIFSAEKSKGVTKIKCPHCGKEGVIK